MGVFMFSSQCSRCFFSSFLLYSFLYIHLDKCCTNKSNSHRKTIKWYKKFFFHIVDMALVNAVYLYKTQNSKNLQLKEFRLQLIKNIITKYNNQNRISIRRPSIDSPLRLSARHFPSLVPPTTSKGNVMYALIQ